ncbi:Arm DNA-binding domain-containing protein [Polaromonas hydrogenivorans]|uniref:Arm DNA-binding domain-containing protein n=1 Tax=Polaromonas hydrogenivorans TaxID=335476 RepID=UPI0039F01827
MALTDTFVRQVKHTGKATGDKHTDGAGMYLLVKAAGKYWRMDYAHADKRKTLALGVYPAVSLTIHQDPSPTDRCDSHQTHEEDAAETHEIEVARQVKESTPEFTAAMSACLRLVESLGMEHPNTTRAMQRAMALAGPSMHDFMARQARELDLIPDADGYTDDGQPVFSLQAIAAKLDMSMDEAQEAMNAMLADRAALGLPAALVDPATVHRKH